MNSKWGGRRSWSKYHLVRKTKQVPFASTQHLTYLQNKEQEQYGHWHSARATSVMNCFFFWGGEGEMPNLEVFGSNSTTIGINVFWARSQPQQGAIRHDSSFTGDRSIRRATKFSKILSLNHIVPHDWNSFNARRPVSCTFQSWWRLLLIASCSCTR